MIRLIMWIRNTPTHWCNLLALNLLRELAVALMCVINIHTHLNALYAPCCVLCDLTYTSRCPLNLHKSFFPATKSRQMPIIKSTHLDKALTYLTLSKHFQHTRSELCMTFYTMPDTFHRASLLADNTASFSHPLEPIMRAGTALYRSHSLPVSITIISISRPIKQNPERLRVSISDSIGLQTGSAERKQAAYAEQNRVCIPTLL